MTIIRYIWFVLHIVDENSKTKNGGDPVDQSPHSASSTSVRSFLFEELEPDWVKKIQDSNSATGSIDQKPIETSKSVANEVKIYVFAEKMFQIWNQLSWQYLRIWYITGPT